MYFPFQSKSNFSSAIQQGLTSNQIASHENINKDMTISPLLKNEDEIETVNEVLAMEERNGKIYYKVNFTGHSPDYTAWGNYLTPYDLARIRCQEACMKYLIHKHGGQRGNLLANIYARRIQKYFRQYKVRKNSLVINREKSTPKIINNPSKQSTNILTKPKNVLLKQAQLCLDNKKYDDLKKTRSLNFQPLTKNSLVLDEINAQERRRVFAKSKTTITPLTHSDEAKLDPTNKIIIHTSNSISTSNKLYERRKLLAEELHKLKQARLHHHYIVINRPLYKILIENAFNPQNRRADEIEKYLETLLKAYDTELEAIRKRTRSVPPKLNRRTSQLL
ncbi:unnamed protein product [Adineta steineri]|uniref:Uncharacterized protein n=2 Tax=Adineta steineri TaxID=433720 RepID=A0A814QWU1_9BILA|nr:unnamed protein product [Adineta steineri]